MRDSIFFHFPPFPFIPSISSNPNALLICILQVLTLTSGEEMNERVFPRDSPPDFGEHSKARLVAESPSPLDSGEHHKRNMSQDSFTSSRMSYAGYGYGPNPGTYVIQVPKDQIYRVPPPENAHKYKLYTKKKARKGGCRRCMFTFLAIILILVILLVVASAILYLIYKPKAPRYSIESLHVQGINVSTTATSSATISPTFNITLKTENNNGKIGIYYEQGSDIRIYHDGLNLCDGELPAFYQPPKSLTVFSTTLSGDGIVLSKPARDKMVAQQKGGNVPLDIDVKVPVKIKIGSVKTWTITVKVWCNVAVNELTANAKVVSKNCKVKAKPW